MTLFSSDAIAYHMWIMRGINKAGNTPTIKDKKRERERERKSTQTPESLSGS